MNNSGNGSRVSLKSLEVAKKFAKRHRGEKYFRFYCKFTVYFILGIISLLLFGVLKEGWSGLTHYKIAVYVHFPSDLITKEKLADGKMSRNNYQLIIQKSLEKQFLSIKKDPSVLFSLLSERAIGEVHHFIMNNPQYIGRHKKLWVNTTASINGYLKTLRAHRHTSLKNALQFSTIEALPSPQGLSKEQISWLDVLNKSHALRLKFNKNFFLNGDSLEPEAAGVLSAVVGSLLTLLVAITLAFPIGVATAIYLEEFARPSKLWKLAEVNINNLAAVPSIIFGLLGLAIFLNYYELPRSSAMVGGITLALLILPNIIIPARTAIKSVPFSIREAAHGLGASSVQVVFHHVFPSALPGILTGTILSIIRAFGESAPFLMIGMVAFISDVPKSFLSPATTLPVQIFSWARNPDRSFIENTAMAIVILLLLITILNIGIVMLRKRFEKKW